jgi:hypothetical protein
MIPVARLPGFRSASHDLCGMQVAAEGQSAEPTIALEAAAAEALQSAEQTITAQAARIIALERELEAACTAHATAADDGGPDEGSHGLAAWLAAAKCEGYLKQLEAEEGLKELDDLLPLLGESDKSLSERLAALGMKPADAKRFILALRTDLSLGPLLAAQALRKADTSFSVWLNTIGCVDYKPQLLAMGYRNTDDLFELQDETDDFLRSKFSFVGQAKKVHLEKLIKAIRAIAIE